MGQTKVFDRLLSLALQQQQLRETMAMNQHYIMEKVHKKHNLNPIFTLHYLADQQVACLTKFKMTSSMALHLSSRSNIQSLRGNKPHPSTFQREEEPLYFIMCSSRNSSKLLELNGAGRRVFGKDGFNTSPETHVCRDKVK